jgi:hypothetical protein
MSEITTKRSLGGARIDHISPIVNESVPGALNIHPTFEKALKFDFGLGHLLAKIGHSRNTTAERRASANLCSYPHEQRITLNEHRLRRTKPAMAIMEASGAVSTQE